ncbi:transporter [Aquincola tertiaricarbonis]|uniref:Transporter n=1 Tax=Aquincola tertiaricarbonis TaxID=391953 RepID=A0ABY4SAW0_AQUTE|nr:transporter [Aquincola tertiaricarbonis]URI10493.1 transporter [Aquincola tertiaricarbonis]
MTPAAASSYGADESGLICGYRLGPGRHGQDIGSAEAAQWLAARRAGASAHGEFLWLHFNLAHTGSQPWLAQAAQLPEPFFEALKEDLHSTRIERTDHHALIAVINDVHFSFSFEPSEISTLWVHVDRHLVVTARRHALRSIDALRTAAKRGDTIASPIELLEALLRAQADVLVRIVRDVTARVDEVEDELLANRPDARRAKLGAMRRVLVRLQRLLAPEPAALFRLLQHPPAWIDEAGVLALRQSTEEFSVVLRDMSALQERIKLLQEEIAARVNEDNNRSLFVLTVVTVLALPINLIAGLLGMNVGGVPLSEEPHGFWIVVSIVTAFTVIAGLVAWRSRRRD